MEEIVPWRNTDLENIGDILDNGIQSSATQEILNTLNITNNLVSLVTFVDPDPYDPATSKEAQYAAWLVANPNYIVRNDFYSVIGDGTGHAQITVRYTGENTGADAPSESPGP